MLKKKPISPGEMGSIIAQRLVFPSFSLEEWFSAASADVVEMVCMEEQAVVGSDH